MNRIDNTFNRLKQERKTAFIGFLTAGDPDIETCISCVKQLESNGCDIIEIGIPFSDPIAEGPVIQEASLRALQNEITTDDVMRMVSRIREFSQIPLVFLLYYNQIFKYGADCFLKECEAAGIDALIIPDLPMEHREELKPLADACQIQLISLVTPVSSKRKKTIAEHSEGFLYCVTSLGVTGERHEFKADLKAFLTELSAYSDTPKALGFGISTPQQITEMKSYADGVIVGSAIVRQIGRLTNHEITLEDVGSFVKTLADAAHA